MKWFNKCTWFGHTWGDWKYIPPYQIDGKGKYTAEEVKRCTRCPSQVRKTVIPK